MTNKANGEEQVNQNRRLAADKGGRAELLKSELDSVIDDLRTRVVQTFEQSAIHDHEGHLTCRLYLEVLADIQQRFDYRIETGKIAQNELMSTLN